MRLIPATASRALIVALAALFAGCSSTSQGTQTLPSGASQSIARAPGALHQFLPKGPLGRMQRLKLMAEGKLAGPVPHKMLLQQIKLLQNHPRPHFAVRGKSGTVGLWASIPGYDYLLGMNNRLTKMMTDIDTANNSCYEPIGLKVDSSQNIWTSCEYNSSFEEGTVQEYSSAGASTAAYNQGCPSSISGCEWSFSYGFDAAANSSEVVSALTFYEYAVCTSPSSCTYYSGPGFEYWPAGDPSASPTLISLSDCAPVCDVYYMDLDNSGNIWFTFYGYDSTTATYGYGLGEIASPTTSATFVEILPPGTYSFAGGVYVSGGGSVLNVTDQSTRDIYQYNLPLSPGGSPFNTMGPTQQSLFGCGDPVTGSFNQGDTKMAFGDACNWLDKGVVSTNKWKAIPNINFYEPEGAAYTPSDK